MTTVRKNTSHGRPVGGNEEIQGRKGGTERRGRKENDTERRIPFPENEGHPSIRHSVSPKPPPVQWSVLASVRLSLRRSDIEPPRPSVLRVPLGLRPSVSPAGKSTSRLSLRTKHSQPTRGGRQIRQGASETQKGRGRDGNQDTAANAALLIRSNGEAVRCSVSGHDNRIGAPTQLNMKLSLK